MIVRAEGGDLVSGSDFFGKPELVLPEEPDADVDDVAVVKKALVLGDLVERFVDAPGGTVGAVGGHGLDDIRHRQDP